MMRKWTMCQNVIRHAVCMEAYQLKHLRHVFPITRHKKWCHQQTNSLEPPKVAQLVSSAETDVYLEEIKGLTTVEEMVTCIERNVNQTQSKHLQQMFTNLFHMAKENPSIIEELHSDRSFATLCQHTLKHIRNFNRVEIVHLIVAMTFLKVPLNCTLGQASLQMLRHYINRLSLQHITLLDKTLRKQPSNPLVNAVRKALPMTLQIQMGYQLDPKDHWLVVNCLAMAINHNLDQSIIENLVSIVHDNAETLSKAKTVIVLSSMSNLESLTPKMNATVKELLNRINYFVMKLSETETKAVVSALKTWKFFNSNLFTSLSHRCCTECWDLCNTTTLLKAFNSHKFLSSSVLDWVLELLNQDPSPLWEDNRISLLTICQALSEANHEIDKEKFINIIQKCDVQINKLENESPDYLVRLAMHLAILECIPVELMKKVFQPEFISETMKTASERNNLPSLLQCYLTLEQSARLNQECYEGPFLLPDVLKEAIRLRATVMKPIDLVLQQFLEAGLGGPQFMVTGLWTKMGHFIDHLVVMRKEDFPVHLSNEKSLKVVKDSEGFAYVEDVELPENSKVLALLVARQEWFNKDPPRLRGWMCFQQKMLAKMGYNPVIIGPPIEKADQIQDIDCSFKNENL